MRNTWPLPEWMETGKGAARVECRRPGGADPKLPLIRIDDDDARDGRRNNINRPCVRFTLQIRSPMQGLYLQQAREMVLFEGAGG